MERGGVFFHLEVWGGGGVYIVLGWMGEMGCCCWPRVSDAFTTKVGL